MLFWGNNTFVLLRFSVDLTGGQRSLVKLGIRILRDGEPDTGDKRETRLVTWSTTVTTDVSYIDVFHYNPSIIFTHDWYKRVSWLLSLDIICSLKLTIFLQLRSRKKLFASRNSSCPRKIFSLHRGYCLYRKTSPCYPDCPTMYDIKWVKFIFRSFFSLRIPIFCFAWRDIEKTFSEENIVSSRFVQRCPQKG